jgi:hypothetical protein
MKTSDWIFAGVIVVGAYLIWKAKGVLGLNWTLSGINLVPEGLAMDIQVTMIVSNYSTATVTVSQLNCTLYYNGAAVATGGLSQTLQPGQNNVTIPFVVSDLTVLSDLTDAIEGNVDATNFQVKGTGLVDGVPGTFTANYSLPSL